MVSTGVWTRPQTHAKRYHSISVSSSQVRRKYCSLYRCLYRSQQRSRASDLFRSNKSRLFFTCKKKKRRRNGWTKNLTESASSGITDWKRAGKSHVTHLSNARTSRVSFSRQAVKLATMHWDLQEGTANVMRRRATHLQRRWRKKRKEKEKNFFFFSPRRQKKRTLPC